MVMLEEPFPPIVETLRRAAAALRGSEVPFALGGGLACWARGGPESTNDLDLMVRPADAEAALGALERAGMRTLMEGQKVNYEIVTERGKQAASNLSLA